MTDHLPDAPVSPERLDELIETLSELLERPHLLSVAANRDTASATLLALRHYKALRERCEQLKKDAVTCGAGAGCCYQAAENERLRKALERMYNSPHECIWTPLPDLLDAYEGCASIHHVGRDDEGPTLPAYCSDCGGAVVVSQSEPNT